MGHHVRRLRTAIRTHGAALAAAAREHAALAQRPILALLEHAAQKLDAAGDRAGANDLVAFAAGLAPADIEVLHLCGVLHRRLGDTARSFAQFARVLELQPGFAYTEFEIGHTCMSLRQTAEALRWYRKSIESAPAFVPAYLAAARTERMLGHGFAALELLERALEREPERAELLRDRAEILAAQGERELAAETYKRLADLHGLAPADTGALITLLNRAGRFAEAVTLARQAGAELQGDAAVLLEVAHATLARGFDRDAVEAAARAREAGPAWRDTRAVQAAVREAIAQARPFALVRLGAGEARFLAALDAQVRAELGAAAADRIGDSAWRTWFGTPRAEVAEADQERLATLLADAVLQADIVGLPGAARLAADHQVFGYLAFLEQGTGDLEANRLADAAVHVRLHEADPFYAETLAGVRHLRVVAPHPHLAARLAARLGIAAHETIVIPAAGGAGGAPPFPDHFEAVLAALQPSGPGTVTLVAGGLPGKIYAGRVRALGGIAIDIGALADAWMGVNTRPGRFADVGRWQLP